MMNCVFGFKRFFSEAEHCPKPFLFPGLYYENIRLADRAKLAGSFAP